MKKIRRFGSLLLALIMVFSMSMVAFAAEVENNNSDVGTAKTRGAELLYGKSAYLSNGNGSFSFNVDERETGVSIVVFVSGNSSMRYGISIENPQGDYLNMGTVYGNGQTITANNITISRGQYEVHVNAFGTSGPVNVLVQIFK